MGSLIGKLMIKYHKFSCIQVQHPNSNHLVTKSQSGLNVGHSLFQDGFSIEHITVGGSNMGIFSEIESRKGNFSLSGQIPYLKNFPEIPKKGPNFVQKTVFFIEVVNDLSPYDTSLKKVPRRVCFVC